MHNPVSAQVYHLIKVLAVCNFVCTWKIIAMIKIFIAMNKITSPLLYNFSSNIKTLGL